MDFNLVSEGLVVKLNGIPHDLDSLLPVSIVLHLHVLGFSLQLFVVFKELMHFVQNVLRHLSNVVNVVD